MVLFGISECVEKRKKGMLPVCWAVSFLTLTSIPSISLSSVQPLPRGGIGPSSKSPLSVNSYPASGLYHCHRRGRSRAATRASLSHSVGEQDGERASRQTESSLDPAWLGYAIHHGLHARKYAVERERGVRKEERKQRTGRARSVCLPLSQVQSVI